MSALGVRYGGDWNPEQWDDATITEDIRLMGEAKVNLVTLGVFSWALTEPEEGRYDFAWLIDIMDRCAEAGISVDLATGTASPPAWLARTYPETLPIDRDGRVLEFGSRQHYSPTSPIYREKATALTRALAQAVAFHPALALWHINNEYGCHVSESFDPVSIAAFRTWLAERYLNIDALNASWGTTFWSQRYASFDEIGAPASLPTFHNPGHLRDWRHFFSDQLRACYEAEAAVLREITPDVPITTNFMGMFAPIDYWTWAEAVDVVADDSYPDPATPFAAHEVAMTGDLMRSLGGNRPFLLMEQAPGAVQWRESNATKRPGQYRLWSLSRVGHGADGILQFQWRQSESGSETFHSGMLPHAGTETPQWREVCELGEDLDKLADVVGQVPTNRIGIVLDWKAQWAGEALISRAPLDHFREVRHWHRTWWEAGFGVDILPVDAEFAPYDIVVIPGLVAVPGDGSDLAARIRRAAEAGTHVLLAGPTAHTDAQLHAFLGGYGGPLAREAGVRIYDHACEAQASHWPWTNEPTRPRIDRISGAVSTPAAQGPIELSVKADSDLAKVAQAAGLDEGWCTGEDWADLLETTNPDVEVLARYAQRGAAADYAGVPAITRLRFSPSPLGRVGAIWWVGTQLQAPGRVALAALTASSANLAPTGAQLWPAGIECVSRGDCLFFLNHSDREITLPGVLTETAIIAGGGSGEGTDLVLPARTGAVIR
ncbi:beta-galactosidase [Nanchangia anserum]|uniref:Beta-galactosidase n=1 Tax=Nanchangia anserum TaxID=2692125 RepID=A0A8I0KW78_9ACTO|nr:beta-galactosidase [Nanchangia anserum]MBD3689724.1 beta-galactosidase [Nanchangia anserum]QOX81896.1 beta-galactosidase [Nanchangia anserum]